jgi:hypothetical protein
MKRLKSPADSQDFLTPDGALQWNREVDLEKGPVNGRSYSTKATCGGRQEGSALAPWKRSRM